MCVDNGKYMMKGRFVSVHCDVHCDWHGPPPRYRAFVDHELFTERTWIWEGAYLQEQFQILAKPGIYHIRYQLLDTAQASLYVENWRVEPAQIDQSGVLTIVSPCET